MYNDFTKIVVYFNYSENRRRLLGEAVVYQCKIYNDFIKIVVYCNAFRYKCLYTSIIYPNSKPNSYAFVLCIFVSSSSCSLLSSFRFQLSSTHCLCKFFHHPHCLFFLHPHCSFFHLSPLLEVLVCVFSVTNMYVVSATTMFVVLLPPSRALLCFVVVVATIVLHRCCYCPSPPSL